MNEFGDSYIEEELQGGYGYSYDDQYLEIFFNSGGKIELYNYSIKKVFLSISILSVPYFVSFCYGMAGLINSFIRLFSTSKISASPYFFRKLLAEILPPAFLVCPPPEPIPSQI